MLTGLLMTVAAAAPPMANDYRLDQNWLCRPDRRDACSISRDLTNISPDGTLTVSRFTPVTHSDVDCFYVYPTVSYDESGNSDMVANDEEFRVIEAQFARFGAQCRTFAPLYRQVTLTALRAAMAGQPIAADRELNYSDVRDAWNSYLAHDNDGRPFVLIGHSQGTGLLKRLVAEEIDGKPIAGQMLSAMLIGSNIMVVEGQDAGGDFESTPLCRSAEQIGCVISYVSFRDTAPPPAESRFGKPTKNGLEVACTNPSALAGGSATLRPAFATGMSWQMARDTGPWVQDRTIATQFVGLPGLLTAECVRKHGASYLSVTVNADPNDPRTDDVPGDVVVGDTVLSDWGLHLIDVSIAYDDLVALIPLQHKTWQANQAKD